MTFVLEARQKVTFNNDPQRRCYNGHHYSTASYWTEWSIWESGIPTREEAESKAEWHREFFTKRVYEFRTRQE